MTSTIDNDFLVYPVCFGYQQYIELAVKGLIRDAERLFDGRAALLAGHRLDVLWTRCRPLLERLDGDSPDLDRAEHVILRFHELDPDSQRFRYSLDSKGGCSRWPDSRAPPSNSDERPAR
jgi:hypothetical protein